MKMRSRWMRPIRRLGRHEEEGVSLNSEYLAEYNKLCQELCHDQYRRRARTLTNLLNDDKTKRDALPSAQDQLDTSRRKIDRLESEEAKLQERKENAERNQAKVQAELKNAKGDLDELRKRKQQIAQTEAEYNEKLEKTLQDLQRAGAEKHEKESEIEFKETLAALKRTFPRRQGPHHRPYMRVQRLGQATFVPIAAVQVKPINEKIPLVCPWRPPRHRRDHLRLIARHVCYDRVEEVKAITLEGTVFHCSGIITGGTSQQGGRHFEDQEVESLRRCEAELRGKLAEVFKSRPNANAEEQLIKDETRLRRARKWSATTSLDRVATAGRSSLLLHSFQTTGVPSTIQLSRLARSTATSPSGLRQWANYVFAALAASVSVLLGVVVETLCSMGHSDGANIIGAGLSGSTGGLTSGVAGAAMLAFVVFYLLSARIVNPEPKFTITIVVISDCYRDWDPAPAR
ncbi:condensin complex subunit SMC1 [Rhodotorula toruloides]|uniref:Condensin complex subunit SMC1 n=1 Tax=Rhodotorula toruloides TaxID=5286 RepID=A0A511KAD6_RHOTO|nr:condensin complex subunit SMC1 [Rhodotorula toruloides]